MKTGESFSSADSIHTRDTGLDNGILYLSDKSATKLQDKTNALLASHIRVNVINGYYAEGKHHLVLLVSGKIKITRRK